MRPRHLSHSFLLAACTALAAASCDKPPAHDPRTDPPLVLTAIVQADTGAQRGFTGIVTARVQSDLGFRVPGKITERLVDVGQSVRRGQAMLRLDPNDLTLALSARAADMDAARARSVQADADETRLRNLMKAGAVSAQSYDLAKAAADSARAQLAAAEAQARVARNSNGYAELLADVDGVVVSTLAEPGQVVGAGQIVVKLAAAGPREAAVSLPETMRPPLASTARASLYGETGEGSSARLRQLSESADEQTRTFEARYVLDGPAASAPLGSTVTIRLADGGEHRATRVPLGAIYDDGGKTGAWVIDPKSSTVSLHPVRIARLDEEDAFVASGLTVGEQVVALGAHRLHEGQRVRAEAARKANP